MVSSNIEISLLEIVPPPKLYLLIGPVNTLYEAFSKVWSKSEIWLPLCNVKKNEYHGGSFAGNGSRKLLKCASILKDMCPKNSRSILTPSIRSMEWLLHVTAGSLIRTT